MANESTNLEFADTTLAASVENDNYTDTATSTPGEDLAISVILVALSLFGTFGNGLVLYVFTRKRDKVTSTIFILSLAWCDFFTCLIIIPFTVAKIQLDSEFRYDAVCKLYQFFITSNVPLSAFIMVAVAVDRYFSICHPFLHAVTPKRARVSIVCLCFFAFVLGIITACMVGVYGDWETIKTNSCALEPPTHELSNTTSGNGLHNNIKNMAVVDGTGNGTEFAYRRLEAVINIDSLRGHHQNASTLDAGAAYTGSEIDSIPSPTTCVIGEEPVIEYYGYCSMNNILISQPVVEYYQRVYQSIYIISLACVFTLYFLIYRSVVKRRAWRRKQKSWSHSPMTANANNANHHGNNKTAAGAGGQAGGNDQGENMELNPKPKPATADADGEPGKLLVTTTITGDTSSSSRTTDTALESSTSNFKNGTKVEPPANAGNGDGGGGGGSQKVSSSAEKKTNRERRDFNFLANIRTAVMLFVVTIVFIISFLPAWLMTMDFITYQIVLFYIYFVYNVANPVIYAFMNQSFRKELKRVFQRGTHVFRNG